MSLPAPSDVSSAPSLSPCRPPPSARIISTRLLHRPAPEPAAADLPPLLTGPSDWIIPPPMTLALVWFFALPGHCDAAAFLPAARLAAALERLLSHYPHAAGRLVRGQRRRVDVDGVDGGVPFVAADSECRIDELALQAGRYTDTRCLPASLRLVAEMDYSRAMELPLLQVQHTRMGCGGVALGIRFSHIVVDGEALFTFVSDWAELYSSGGSTLAVAPSLDRAWTIPSEAQLQRAASYAEEVLVTEPPPGSAASGEGRPSILRVFRFSRSALTALKDEATSAGSWVSTYEALTAWLLQRMYAARVAAGVIAEHELGRSMKLVFACNWRARLPDTPAPPKYWANGSVPLSLRMPLSELLQNNLRANAARVHDAVHTATADRILATFAWAASQPDMSRVAFNVDARLDCISTAWSRMGMYRASFDGVSPLRICLPHLAGADGVMLLLSTPGQQAGTEGDELDVYVGLSETAMEALEAEAEWKRIRAL